MGTNKTLSVFLKLNSKAFTSGLKSIEGKLNKFRKKKETEEEIDPPSFEDLMGLALGFLDMSLDEFWDFTPRQLQLKLDHRKQYEDLLQRYEWERLRFQTTALINNDKKKADKIYQEDMERGEMAAEAGMLHGIDAYNDMNGDS